VGCNKWLSTNWDGGEGPIHSQHELKMPLQRGTSLRSLWELAALG
jgi:hypothetical protein